MNRGRRRPRRAAVAVLLSCTLLGLAGAGCSGAVPKPVPPAKERAGTWNRRGLAAEARGDRDGALAAFRKELKINRSIEDTDGSAVALVNLARLHRRNGELPSAKETIDSALLLVPPESPLFPETAFEKGKIELAAGDLPAAKGWAEKAVLAEKGASAGRMRNLLARILFLEGKIDDARARAGEALEANRTEGARGEEANSLRLLGDIAAARADRKAAEGLYLEALSIDKGTAESGKIASDLRALGAVAEARGDTAGALAFYSRAVEVSRNGDDPKEAAAALLETARLHEKAGSPDKAKSALAEREKLLRANEKK
jgi:tetratricopeptide (TPR) repeat protein